MIRKIITAALLAAALGGASVPAEADIYLRVAPPAPRVEVVPPARRGYIWAPGHWDARGNRYYWVRGAWVRERRGFRYRAPRWTERNGRWYREDGGWARGDRDGDGAPNRMDAHPDNPNRR
jgi:hypothetical protein